MTYEVVLGVGGGIAAYKACGVLRRLRESGVAVTVVPTAAALQFVGAPTWEALSGRPVSHDAFSSVPDVQHVRLGRAADAVAVVPATANLLAKAAHGLADDLLTNTLLTATCPVLMFPAMHTEMWQNPATRANVDLLRERGVFVIDPDEGRLTGGDSGPGRLPEPGAIVPWLQAALEIEGRGRDLEGLRIVVSAGGTREPLDPVRYIGNRSSGRQAVALAASAAARGAAVTLVAGHLEVEPPAGIEVMSAPTAQHMLEAVTLRAEGADIVVMAAAVADFRASQLPDHKIKKSGGDGLSLSLVPNPDILATLVSQRGADGPVLVGFAAETGDERTSWLDFARRKLAAKGCDFLVANPVGADRGFETEDNEAVILSSDGSEVVVASTSKTRLAHAIWDEVRPAAG